MIIYQQQTKQMREIKDQVLVLQKEYQILKEERDEEIAGKQLMRTFNLAAPNHTFYINTSRVEQALYCLNEQEKLIKNKIKELIPVYKQKEQWVNRIEKILYVLSKEECWILKQHYGENISMQQLAYGDAEKRIQLWRLERKARRSFAKLVETQKESSWLHNREKQ